MVYLEHSCFLKIIYCQMQNSLGPFISSKTANSKTPVYGANGFWIQFYYLKKGEFQYAHRYMKVQRMTFQQLVKKSQDLHHQDAQKQQVFRPNLDSGHSNAVSRPAVPSEIVEAAQSCAVWLHGQLILSFSLSLSLSLPSLPLLKETLSFRAVLGL